MHDLTRAKMQPPRSGLFGPGPRHRARPQRAGAAHPLLAQQRALGNQAMQRVAGTCPLVPRGPSFCPFGGVCHRCPVRVQAKLRVGRPDDKYEQEADRVAEQVMSMPEPRTGVSASVQRACTECEDEMQRQPLGEEQETLQTSAVPGGPEQRQDAGFQGGAAQAADKGASGDALAVSPGYLSKVRAVRGGGRPITRSERAFFEPRFGRDFAAVRIHEDARADEAARSVGARAYTLGSDIVFRSRAYAEETTAGRFLMAHELTHVVQQEAAGPRLARYDETTEASSRLLEAAREVSEVPHYRWFRGYFCLQKVLKPMKDLTFRRWIPAKCAAQGGRGALHARDWDAFGHCWVACEGSRRCGNAAARDLGTMREVARELGFEGPHDSCPQDLLNQLVGRELAYSSGKCYTLCDAAYRSGLLNLTAPIRTCVDCSNPGGRESAANCPTPNPP